MKNANNGKQMMENKIMMFEGKETKCKTQENCIRNSGHTSAPSSYYVVS